MTCWDEGAVGATREDDEEGFTLSWGAAMLSGTEGTCSGLGTTGDIRVIGCRGTRLLSSAPATGCCRIPRVASGGAADWAHTPLVATKPIKPTNVQTRLIADKGENMNRATRFSSDSPII
ncbi:MAG: hypothetical protein N2Z21_00290 [Candidatus Sumerlaeaceae bacterium]|nr:hypothetical protein [Candidatus Sumerlaeaceae bacterium]